MNKGRYKHEIPLDLNDKSGEYANLLQPLGQGPLLPEPRPSPHKSGCWCVRCWNAGLEYGEYLKQKKLNEL